jgi:hypothetical protein
MIQDPKQIVTPHAFEVDPDLLGLPLATPKRRLFALLVDLLLASILTALGAFILASTITILFFWLAVKSKGTIWWKNLIRYSVAGFASIFVFGITFSLADDDTPKTGTINVNNKPIATADDLDLTQLLNDISDTDFSDQNSLDQLGDKIERLSTSSHIQNDGSIDQDLFEPEFREQLFMLNNAISENDSLAIDFLRSQLAPVIASTELNKEKDRSSKLISRVKELSEENEVLEEQIENPSFRRVFMATAEDFGLRFGWLGIYFIICLPVFKGQTLGKKFLSLKVIRLNNKEIGLWYSFERFGGYAAGIATGLLGFFQIFWDPNRQAIHDKIAGTVVIDTRESKKKKYAELRQKLYREENILE